MARVRLALGRHPPACAEPRSRAISSPAVAGARTGAAPPLAKQLRQDHAGTQPVAPLHSVTVSSFVSLPCVAD
jgi:hypothetical protein